MKPPLRADDEIRTRDPHLGKVMLYQLSHVRRCYRYVPTSRHVVNSSGYRCQLKFCFPCVTARATSREAVLGPPAQGARVLTAP
jgi:hypothetical protein